MFVQAPPGDPAASKARFNGIWSGWGCQLRGCDIKQAVEKISEGAATIVYAGASKESGLAERVQAVFAGDELKATRSTGAVLAFRIRTGNSGVMEFVGSNSGVIRVAGVLSQTPALTKITENGQPATLEAVIYKHVSNGSFPVLKFNHGSIDNGDKSALFTST